MIEITNTYILPDGTWRARIRVGRSGAYAGEGATEAEAIENAVSKSR